MKILVAGGTGVIGRRLIPQLIEAGHTVTGTTRQRDRQQVLTELGASAQVVDALDRQRLIAVVLAERPDAIIHQLTDQTADDPAANARLRVTGTRNLVEAARYAGVETMIAHSSTSAYRKGDTLAVETEPLDPQHPVTALEAAVAVMPRGIVLRYGELYGTGTWYAPGGSIAARVQAGGLALTPEWTCFLNVEDAAAAAVTALSWPAGPVNIVDNEPAIAAQWLPVYAASLGAPLPKPSRRAAAAGRPVSNQRAMSMGFRLKHPTWRHGIAKADPEPEAKSRKGDFSGFFRFN